MIPNAGEQKPLNWISKDFQDTTIVCTRFFVLGDCALAAVQFERWKAGAMFCNRPRG